MYWRWPSLKLTQTVIYYYRRQPSFSNEPIYLKQGIGSVYVMVDFICKGYLELWEDRESSENYKMKKIYQLWDSNPGPSAFEASALPLSYED